MAAANESQGLKIAVAAFVTLSVILAVTSLFPLLDLFSGRRPAGDGQRGPEYRQEGPEHACRPSTRICGARSASAPRTPTPPRPRSTPTSRRSTSGSTNLGNQVNAAMQKVQQSGRQAPGAPGRFRARSSRRSQSFRSETNKNYISSLDRMTELMENLSLLSDGDGGQLPGPAAQPGVVHQRGQGSRSTSRPRPPRTARSDLDGRAQEARRRAADPPDQGRFAHQTDNDKKTTEIANLNDKIRQLTEDSASEKDLLTSQHPRAARPGRAERDDPRPSRRLHHLRGLRVGARSRSTSTAPWAPGRR